MSSETEYARRLEADESVSDAVLRTVAAVSDRPIADLPPLQECVDAASLDAPPRRAGATRRGS